ncbi:hypothetical protein MGMO_53c00270 [Methyloglobulus morosus KoM1]|uniref:Uncharacterized protein n=1 Tax=Methyloglobulus morosus KoM1 TaxID=1116472 RepID=V5C760_9GAMM|nr:hypothetical protein [Methyloglobulus morosus]ESS72568.1 hypothetical protein MGMO_53c00270 [Methyloglobulus morosus KoM1]
MLVSESNSEKYRSSLLAQLDRLSYALSNNSLLGEILDATWQTHVLNEIKNADLKSAFESEKACMFFQFKEQPERVRLVDRRLEALNVIPAIQNDFRLKVKNVKQNRFFLSYRNYLFELMVLGAFAEAERLVDMEVPVAAGGSTVDGLVDLGERKAYVEVTFTSQKLFEVPKDDVICVSIQEMIEQVVYKVVKKVSCGKQLGLVDGKPSVIALGMNFNGADELSVKLACEQIFSDQRFAGLSALLASQRFDFSDVSVYHNPSAIIPLTQAELGVLRNLI